MRIDAAVLWEQGRPLSVETAELDGPGAGEVLVEMKAAGVCHSDLHPARGDWPMKVPVVLGHEGAGIVREVGAGVTSVSPGDHVVLCWAPACGVCPPCRQGRAVLCDRVEKVTFRNNLPSGATHLHARQQPQLSFALRDLSLGGLSAISPTPISRGERLAVFFPQQGESRGWDAYGRVIRCDPTGAGYRVAVAFDPLPAA